jgi:hypothetical protein
MATPHRSNRLVLISTIAGVVPVNAGAPPFFSGCQLTRIRRLAQTGLRNSFAIRVVKKDAIFLPGPNGVVLEKPWSLDVEEYAAGFAAPADHRFSKWSLVWLEVVGCAQFEMNVLFQFLQCWQTNNFFHGNETLDVMVGYCDDWSYIGSPISRIQQASSIGRKSRQPFLLGGLRKLCGLALSACAGKDLRTNGQKALARDRCEAEV